MRYRVHCRGEKWVPSVREHHWVSLWFVDSNHDYRDEVRLRQRLDGYDRVRQNNQLGVKSWKAISNQPQTNKEFQCN